MKRKTAGTKVQKKVKKSKRVAEVVERPIDPETGKPIKKARAPWGSKKATKHINPKYVNVRQFYKEDEEQNLSSCFLCKVIEQSVTRQHCAMGLCGKEGRKCPHYRAPEEQALYIAYCEDREEKQLEPTSTMKILCNIVKDKKGNKKVIYNY
jgi:hypothetical protein